MTDWADERAYEIAGEIAASVFKQIACMRKGKADNDKVPTELIAQALRQARNEALDDAAAIAFEESKRAEQDDLVRMEFQAFRIANEIRALKSEDK